MYWSRWCLGRLARSHSNEESPSPARYRDRALAMDNAVSRRNAMLLQQVEIDRCIFINIGL
jgi:hypothetical protein